MPTLATITTAVSSTATAMVKLIGTNGQISLGKQYAGRQVLVEQHEPGVWLIRTATIVPDNERWLHAEPVAVTLREALTWAQSNPASDTGNHDVLQRLRDA